MRFLYQLADINECSKGTDHCDRILMTCHNIIGSYECHCIIGYELIPDGKSCQGDNDNDKNENVDDDDEDDNDDDFNADENECIKEKDTCNKATSECLNVIGSYECLCQVGYEKGSIKHSCVG